MADKQPQPKIGAGHAQAMFRQGLAELRAAVTLPDANVPQPTVHGIAGTRTPGEVMLDKKLDVRDPDERPAILDKYFKQPEADRESNVREPEPREPERD